MEPVTVEDLHVTPGRLTARVRVRTQPDARYTTPALAARAAADHPNLPHHSCVNAHGPTFAAVMERTSLPHLLEHLIIDHQVRAEPPDSQLTFAGYTQWLDEGAGLATITVNFRSDACALRAVAYACSYLNDALKEEPHD